MMPVNEDDMSRLLSKLQGIPHFQRTLTGKAVASCYNSTTATNGPTMPAWFVREYGESVKKTVLLQLESSPDAAWRVNLNILISPKGVTQVIFNGLGWKAFVNSNGLKGGDSLIFALKAMSEFDVFVFRSSEGNRPSRNQTSDCCYQLRNRARLCYTEVSDNEEESVASIVPGKEKKPVANNAGLAPHSPSEFPEGYFASPSCLLEDADIHQYSPSQ